MNKVASFAAVLALIAMGAYFYSAPNRSGSAVDNTTPAGLSSAEGGSCCSQGASQVATAAVKSSCCSEGATQMVSAGGESCCAGKTEACCSEKTELVKTEAGSCCSEKSEACCTEGKSETVATEAKSCPCQAGKTETVTTGAEKAECHGDCESGCCQEKKAEGEIAKTEGGEGK